MINFLMILLGIAFAILCVFLILVVLIQPGGQRGGGLGGLGGGAAGSAISETLGATQGEKTLSRWTSWGMAAFFVIALLLTVLGNQRQGSALDLAPGEQPELGTVTVDEATEAAPPAVPVENMPAPAPATE